MEISNSPETVFGTSISRDVRLPHMVLDLWGPSDSQTPFSFLSHDSPWTLGERDVI